MISSAVKLGNKFYIFDSFEKNKLAVYYFTN